MNIAMGPGASTAWNQVASAEIRYYWAIEQVGGIPYGDRVPVELDTRALATYTLATALNFGLAMRATAFFEIAGEASWSFSALPCQPAMAPCSRPCECGLIISLATAARPGYETPSVPISSGRGYLWGHFWRLSSQRIDS